MKLSRKEIKGLNPNDFTKTLDELKSELVKARGQAATGSSPKNTLQIRMIKKGIARILTRMNAQKSAKEVKK